MDSFVEYSLIRYAFIITPESIVCYSSDVNKTSSQYKYSKIMFSVFHFMNVLCMSLFSSFCIGKTKHIHETIVLNAIQTAIQYKALVNELALLVHGKYLQQ